MYFGVDINCDEFLLFPIMQLQEDSNQLCGIEVIFSTYTSFILSVKLFGNYTFTAIIFKNIYLYLCIYMKYALIIINFHLVNNDKLFII